MVLYLGNMLSKHGKSVSMIETLVPLFSKHLAIRAYSNKKNKLARLLQMLWAVIRFRKETDVVLIDSFSTAAFYYTVAVAWLCKLLKMPYAPILHGGDYPKRLKQSPNLCRMIFHNSAANITPSDYLGSHLTENGYTSLHIPNFLPIENYDFVERKAFSPKLLWVRAFHDIYNPILAIRILSSLLKFFPKAELCMVGPDKDGSLTAVKALAKQLGITSSLRITGKIPKADWIRLSDSYDIFINTTNFDNMPISLLEAMALGLPVVTTDVGGLPYIIKDKTTGILVSPDDECAFVNGIKSILENPEFGNHLALNARKFTESLKWEIVEKEWLAFFENYVK